MQLTWLGHASFKLRTKEGKIIYIDPAVERYAGFWSFLEKADLILISHFHSDHASLDTIKQIRQDNTVILGAAEASSEIDGCETMAMNVGKEIGGIKVLAVPAYTPRRAKHSERGEVLGFIIDAESEKVYFASDTGIIPEMSAIGHVDVAILPVGGTDTMSAAEAVKVVELLKPKVAIPSHWGKTEGTIDDAELFKELVEARMSAKTKVIVLNPGESAEI